MRKMRSVVALAVFGALAIGCATDVDEVDSVEQAAKPEVQNPVVFVHGCYPGPPLAPPPYENAQGAALWGAFQGIFSANGYAPSELNVWLDPGEVCGDITVSEWMLAEYIGEVLDNSEAGKVDIIAHSMGALTVRAYLQHGGHHSVDDVVFLAGSNHGTFVASAFAQSWQDTFGAPAYQGALQMANPYACQGESADDVQYDLNGCLTPTGRTTSTDETPGKKINYLNLWLNNDEINQPQHSACLNQDFIGDCSDDVNVEVGYVTGLPDGTPAHVAMLFNPNIVFTALAHVQ